MGGLNIVGRLLRRWHAYRAPTSDVSLGFTIVEVMIVLAVTGALFVATAILINGKQNQAGFNEAVQQIQSQVQQVVNDVSSGYFPSNANFECTAPSGGGGPITLSGAISNAQGSNSGCIFAGKMIQFQISGTNPEQFAVFTLAGAQKDASGEEATSFAGSSPKVVAPGVGYPAGYPDLTVTNILQNGLATAPGPADGHPMMWYDNGGPDTPVGAVAFVPTFASYDSNGNIVSGSQTVNIVPVTGTTLGASKAATVDTANTNLASSVVNPSGGVSVCFASGGTNESGLLVIGANNNPSSVTMTIKDGTTSCGK